MENVIKNLLSAKIKIIAEGTVELKTALKNPDSIHELCELIVSSNKPQIRQYAAVLLRKRFAKLSNWESLPEEQQDFIKNGLVKAMFQEKNKNVCNAISQLIGVILLHRSTKVDLWFEEILKAIFEHCNSNDSADRQLGSEIFSILTDASPEQFIAHMEFVSNVFRAAFAFGETNVPNDDATVLLVKNFILGMMHLGPYILGNNYAEQTYTKLIPSVLTALERFAVLTDPSVFAISFELLDTMVECTPRVLSVHTTTILNFCIEIAKNSKLNNTVREKGIAFIGGLVRLKKRMLTKQKLIEPILNVIFSIISQEQESESEDNYYLDDTANSPLASATQTMDLLALNVPPEKLIPPLLAIIEPALQMPDPLPRRAAYLCLAVIAEGCAEHICENYLEAFLTVVRTGIVDSVPIVRNAAFFALGQFSEYLQPDISHYAPQIMPILFDFLHQLCIEVKSGNGEPKHIQRMFYALETFCENLGDGLMDYLPILMERLFEAMTTTSSQNLRELSFNTLSAAVMAAKSNITPYFPQLMVILQPYLIKTKAKEIVELQAHAIDTFAAVVRSVGKEAFMPLTTDTANFVLSMMEDVTDPEILQSLYYLLSALSVVLGEDMNDLLPKVMDRVYASVLANEELIHELKDQDTVVESELNQNDSLSDDIDIDRSDEENSDDGNDVDYKLEQSILREKEGAIECLRDFAINSGASFLPYVRQSFENVYKMLDHPSEDIRRTSIDTLGAFILALYKEDDILSAYRALSMLIPKLSLMIHNEDEASVVVVALGCYETILKELSENALPTEAIRDIIFEIICDVFTGKLKCQFYDTDDGDGDGNDSEYDELLLENAGNLLPLFGNAMSHSVFVNYFDQIYPLLLDKLKESNHDDDNGFKRTLVYGILGECFQPLGHLSGKYYEKFQNLLLEGLQNQKSKTRQNAVFALGELVYNSDDASYESFPRLLTCLAHAVSHEKNASVLDNICGAIARIILTNSSLVPLNQVFPVLMKTLPLRKDFSENLSLFKCFKLLFMNATDLIIEYLEAVLMIMVESLYKKRYEEDDEDSIKQIGISLLTDIRESYTDEFEAVLNKNADIAEWLQAL